MRPKSASKNTKGLNHEVWFRKEVQLTEPIHPQDLPWDGRFEAISDLLRVARTHTLPSFLSGQTVATTKSDGTLVTEADQQAEVAMRNWLSEHFAQDAVVGEEGPVMHGVSNWTWVLDPIDGTASFGHQVPLWGTLVALRYDDNSVAGACELPALDLGAKGTIQNAHLLIQGHKQEILARPSQCRFQDATLATTGWDYFRMAGTEEAYVNLARKAGRTKGWGDCYGLWMLLAGRVDVVVEPLLHPWDIEWVWPLAQASGIKLTDWHGRDCASPRQCIVSHGGPLHDEVASILQPHALDNV